MCSLHARLLLGLRGIGQLWAIPSKSWVGTAEWSWMCWGGGGGGGGAGRRRTLDGHAACRAEVMVMLPATTAGRGGDSTSTCTAFAPAPAPSEGTGTGSLPAWQRLHVSFDSLTLTNAGACGVCAVVDSDQPTPPRAAARAPTYSRILALVAPTDRPHRHSG